MPEPIHLATLSAHIRTAAEHDGPVGAFDVVDWNGVVDDGKPPFQIIDQGEPGDTFHTLSEALRAAEDLIVAFDVDRLANGGLTLDDGIIEIWDEVRDVAKRHLTPSAFQQAITKGGVLIDTEAETLVRELLDRPDTSIMGFSPREYDAALAGLRLLARELAAGRVSPDDNDIGQIMTNGMEHPGLTAEQIHALADAWQAGERDIAR